MSILKEQANKALLLSQSFSTTMQSLVDRNVLTLLDQTKSMQSFSMRNAEFSIRIAEHVRKLETRQLLEFPDIPPAEIEALEPDNLDLSEEHKSNLVRVDGFPLRVISEIASEPEKLWNLTPRQFEEFTATLLAELGFQNVLLTPSSGEGGKDIIASQRINGIPLTFYFECKRYAKDNKIQLPMVRALLGTVAQKNEATMGVLVTTSTFTKGCRDLIFSESRLDGKNYEDILEWVREIEETQ